MRSPDSPTALHKLTGSLLWGLLLVLAFLGAAPSEANNPPGQLVASFVYNPSGLRIEKQGERGVERFTYDEQSLLQAYDENSTTLAKYDYGAERLVSLTSSSEPVQFYLTDALNSVVNLTNTAGSVQARYQYDAFGNQRAQSGSSYNRFAFTGYVEDKETDLLYAKARYYDSDTGRFLSQDAWEGQNDLPPSLHKYLYAYQNPTVYVDPDGNIVLPVLAAYFLYTSIQTAVDVGVDRGIAGLTNDDNFSYTKSIATNFAINAATAGVGGKIKNAGKAVQFGVETAIDAGLTTAYEVGIEGKEAGSTLLENTASGVVGRVVGDKVARQLSGSKVTVDGGSTPSPRQAQSKSEATVTIESDASPAIRQEESARVGDVGVANKPLPGTLSELETRKWYHSQEDLIPEKIDTSQPIREQSLQAFQLRNEIRTDARALMSNRELAAELDVTDPNLTLKQIVQRKYQVKGLVGDDLWADILKSSTESRPSVDKSLGLTRKE